MYAELVKFNPMYAEGTAKVMIEVKNRNKREAYRAAKEYAAKEGVEVPAQTACRIWFDDEQFIESGIMASVMW